MAQIVGIAHIAQFFIYSWVRSHLRNEQTQIYPKSCKRGKIFTLSSWSQNQNSPLARVLHGTARSSQWCLPALRTRTGIETRKSNKKATMGKAWLPILVAAIGGIAVDGASYFRSLDEPEQEHPGKLLVRSSLWVGFHNLTFIFFFDRYNLWIE